MDIVNAVADVAEVIETVVFGPGLTPYLADMNSPFRQVNISKASTALLNEMPRIIGYSLAEWTTYLAGKRSSLITGFVLYLPNPGILPRVKVAVPTGLKIGGRPVKLMMGGTKRCISLVGVGLEIPSASPGYHQIWRMDYGDYHRATSPTSDTENAVVWKKDEFHYHVVRHPRQ
jgi:hypothetical protein